MVNHFRTLLLNLSDQGLSTEHITKGFAARVLPGKLLSFYSLLFPAKESRAEKQRLGQGYLEIITGAGLDEVFTLSDERITYKLDIDFNNFKTSSVDYRTLINKLSTSQSVVTSMLSMPKHIDTDKYDNLWHLHNNSAYRLAGLISAYVIRLK